MNPLVEAVSIHSPTSSRDRDNLHLPNSFQMALPTETGRCQVSLDLTMWELGRSLTRLFKCILDTLMQHFYFDDWACGCLGSATAALVKREVHVRSPSEQ